MCSLPPPPRHGDWSSCASHRPIGSPVRALLPVKNKPLKTTRSNYHEGDLSLLETTGYLYRDASPAFSSNSWTQGFGLYGFLLETEHSDGSCVNTRKKNIVGISFSFDTATRLALSLVVFWIRDSVVEIDWYRNVFPPLRRMWKWTISKFWLVSIEMPVLSAPSLKFLHRMLYLEFGWAEISFRSHCEFWPYWWPGRTLAGNKGIGTRKTKLFWLFWETSFILWTQNRQIFNK